VRQSVGTVRMQFLLRFPHYTVSCVTAEDAVGNPINVLRGLGDQSRARDEELRAGFKSLESHLTDASKDPV
jgi:hypothetical protein